ncbi:MAG TPA: hypothetical protein DEP82_14550 [Arthrobacter bacterium]|nr:hypothetical protein [Arthrobacter sp.]
MFKIDAPSLAKASGGLLQHVNVIPGAGHQLFVPTKYELVLDGHNRDVPVEGGAITAPVLTEGATAATGGTFAAGTFFWKVTAVTGYGETDGSNEITATLVATGTQAMSWADVAGAQLFRVYRGIAAGAEDTLVTTLPAGTLSFIDTGAAGTPGTVPTVSRAGNVPAGVKTFDMLGTNTTALFQTYRGLDAPVLLGQDAEALVKDAYDRGEDWAVERKLQTLVLNPAAVDLTPVPGTPVTSFRYALGLLEQYARDTSTFAPLISGNALALLLVEQALDWKAPNIQTILGTTAALAGGYGTAGPGALTAPAGSAWLYITGQINIWKGPSEVSPAMDYHTNRAIALAESSYAASVESFTAAVLVGTI